MQRVPGNSTQHPYAPFDDRRAHLPGPVGDAPRSLQLQLDIARVSKSIHQTQASLSRLKVLHTLLLARCLLQEADVESAQARSANEEIGRIRQRMMDAGIAVRPTRPNDGSLLNALAGLDAGELLAQAAPPFPRPA
ncbi:hypothetical protein BV22DRAFT_869999 [Leucogyrophana mollusca]|uniref:Uncharacterized protein n=1 Tax=Leucogyrophana mollusca TaxID=85980 RepID=A0ACB8B125_9AGAM|nr:hypothetical protein BV22DRAFT_869999 [Leucogyrophana mollusca]